SQIIHQSKLKDRLVFKGGTALHHCYLPQMRFSEDLDFTALDSSIALADVKAVLEAPDFLTVKKDYVSSATIKIEKLQYQGPLGLPNSLKVEIDFIQNVVLPAKEKPYKNVWGIKTKVKVMDIKEICAEKIRAASDRGRYRDFYDLLMILKNFDLKLAEIVSLIKQKEIRKPISQKSILKNWQVAKQEKEADLHRLYCSKNALDTDIDKMLKWLKFRL
ncbi:MAG: nucleotidyl transferase AbiEii/AbiGii toxin family protein, partial [Patescibacteria group bacterium]